jgi:hypothetical protein
LQHSGNKKMLSFKPYDFALPAGGSQTILAIGSYFRIQSSSGAVSVTVDGIGTLPSLLAGQGFKGVKYQRLLLTDVSGALNVGTILTASDEFIDNRTYGVNSLDAATILSIQKPLAETGNYASGAATVANTPVTLFTPGSNANGAILLSASAQWENNGGNILTLQSFLAKSSAPATPFDGSVCLATQYVGYVGSGNSWGNSVLPKELFIAAGLGLYFISDTATAVYNSNALNTRFASWRLL